MENIRYILLSIQTEFARKILKKEKTIELRRRFPSNLRAGTQFLIYSSKNDKAIIAKGEIDKIEKQSLKKLWITTRKSSGVSEEYFNEYFDGTSTGVAIYISNVTPVPVDIDISCLNSRFSISPPQSFRYITKEVFEDIAGDI